MFWGGKGIVIHKGFSYPQRYKRIYFRGFLIKIHALFYTKKGVFDARKNAGDFFENKLLFMVGFLEINTYKRISLARQKNERKIKGKVYKDLAVVSRVHL